MCELDQIATRWLAWLDQQLPDASCNYLAVQVRYFRDTVREQGFTPFEAEQFFAKMAPLFVEYTHERRANRKQV